MHLPIKEHQRILSPAWPLQNTVAVNPFWHQIDRPFDEVMTRMSSLVHHALYMPVAWYREKFERGEITSADLELAAKRLGIPTFDPARDESAGFRACESFSDFVDRKLGTRWQPFITYEIAKYASAFFDEGQALAKYPWRELGFYEAWFAAQEFDESFAQAGLTGFYDSIRPYKDRAPEATVAELVLKLGFGNEDAAALYLGRLSVMNVGWGSQFSYHEWNEALGFAAKLGTRSLELVAVQLIVDAALARHFEKIQPGRVAEWRKTFEGRDAEDSFVLRRVWQTALELGRQRQLAARIDPIAPAGPVPRIQVAMCIDVRSETYRRAIENAGPDIETIGFAGFFGLAFEYKKIDERRAAVRAPVLLRSGFLVKEETIGDSPTRRVAKALASSYFRNLRKAPMSSFLFVELFSLPSLVNMARRLVESVNPGQRKNALPRKFAARTRPRVETLEVPSGNGMALEARVNMVAKVLTNMGLKSRFGRLVVLAGHGSANTNNAFASAADCGACGGHAGDVNARLLAEILNDPQIRRELRARAIDIPDDTRFLPAVHETVTDELYLLDPEALPASHREDLERLRAAIARAGEEARAERQEARSTRLDPSPWRRSSNWSEVRPEWSLAGNSSFIVAPRRFTRGADLEGRAFLHDYEWRDDKNFETLELVMTAPMLVTNWINMQYYASTVAPAVYGAGNKLLHNLVNENGVVEGNGGDLRIGLPWQSVHDGDKFVHEPVRLAVFIAAPTEEIEKVIAKHTAVRNLVTNEWLTIHQIDDTSGRILRREKSGDYV